MRHLIRAASVLLLAASVAACIPILAPVASTPTPPPTPSPTPVSVLDAFRTMVASPDFQARGSVSGSVKAKLLLGSASGTVSGSFAVEGKASDVSVGFALLGMNVTYDAIVVDGWSYARMNGSAWVKTRASGKSFQDTVADLVLADEGLALRFGTWLHRIEAANPADVDPTAFGIVAGAGQENLAISALSFWAEADGTPAGVSIEASVDQKVLGTRTHETVTLEIAIDSLSGVTITAPTD
jgi:hypothetical protein